MSKTEAPVYSKNKLQYLSDRNPYSLQNFQVKDYKSQRQKLISLRKLLHTLNLRYGMNYRFRYGKFLIIMHLKQKLKVSF
jgi:hypothetical protein